MYRAVQCSVEVLEGEDVVVRGMEVARHLWNYLRKLNKERMAQDPIPKYPGAFGWYKLAKESWAFRELSGRCKEYTIKDFDIAMRSFFANLRSNPHARPPRYAEGQRTLTFEVGRNAKPVGNFMYKLTVLSKKAAQRHAVVRLHVRPGVRMKHVKLIRITPAMKRGCYLASIVQALGDVEPVAGGYAAVDLGIVNLGALVFEDGDSILYNGRALLDVLRYGSKRAAACKPSGWYPGLSRLRPSARQRQYIRHAANIRRLAVHNFTTDVIRQCQRRGVGVLAVGDLKGIREGKDWGARMNQKLHTWPFREIEEQLRWKGEGVGIEVRVISEAYTSQTCSRCGMVSKSNRVERGLYVCKQCGLRINADVNGAFNMLKQVSPEFANEGVEAILPGLPSPTEGTGGIGEVVSVNHPRFIGRFDLRNWAVMVTPQGYPWPATSISR